MNVNPLHHFMNEAILEGRKAREHCAPNPPVGCVLVRNNRIIARGHTQPPGQDHAEAMALGQLPEASSSMTAYVTLEPCSFHGRTPSCAKTLIQNGVETVYVGMIDPDPRNNGKGIEMLRSAGIQVHLGMMKDIIEQDLKDFLTG
ncbi:bifunctional diaminohydroxyphosphoribosylaminopyrimidine deaminase/5-amino-6-(5-phosphoribosylamino)uracil reductase RibD [Endozoicomonas arenosclerae]|uniref:bifunctional diaminohydroxyphosphoribosylaminopyrimidine deaminase/5-amino-6-(5-phosphoribosylamino)uracil reductase RibD n=1 Tax=Endozoicomonas arenosclerae TaxID=1633495 RepID=UPI0007807282|nr:bifunctional diaminohydroxyphosphoribosylaminopyrimidine deaminase/5-amino-6-(5-phosphoribosylamino)uracil reductase RibD [Endozoicomonas arenosclerae]